MQRSGVADGQRWSGNRIPAEFEDDATTTSAVEENAAGVAGVAADAFAKSDAVSGFCKFRQALMAMHFQKRSDDNEPVQVLENVYIGSYGAALNRTSLLAAGISHILCVSSTLKLEFPDCFVYERVAVADHPTAPIAEAFTRALAFMDSAIARDGKILVHCFAGRSRSATIILAFLISRKGMTLLDALSFLRGKRPQANPNSGFLQQLARFQQEYQCQSPQDDILDLD